MRGKRKNIVQIILILIFILVFTSFINTVKGEESFTHEFVPDWNNFTPSYETTIGDLIFEYNGSYYSFWEAAYENLLYPQLHQIDPDGSHSLWNESEQLIPGLGYQIQVYEEVNCIISGEVPSEDLNIDIQAGWTLLGWIHGYAVNAQNIMDTIPGCTSVGIMINHIVDENGSLEYQYYTGQEGEESFEITRGMAFWIETNQDSVWNGTTVNNSEPYKPNNPPSLEIICPNSVNENESFEVKITKENEPIENAEIEFLDNIYHTNINGIVTLKTPFVNKNEIKTITASKSDYESNNTKITIIDVTNEELKITNPDGGECCSGLYKVNWDVINKQNDDYIIMISYNYQDGEWKEIAEHNDISINSYKWNTTNYPNGYLYKLKIELKIDENVDGIYETIISSNESDDYFSIDNTNDHIGWINGYVLEEINSEQNPIENARVNLIVSDQEKIVKSKSTLTDETGYYNISYKKGSYKIIVSKGGYSTQQENINIWAGRETNLNFTLKQGPVSDLLSKIVHNENREIIDEKIKEKKVGAELSIFYEENISDFQKYIVVYDEINISLLDVENGSISFLIDGDENITGKTIILNVDNELIDHLSNFSILYDGKEIQMADDLLDVLNPNNDGSNPEYTISIGANGTQIIISIPHFSQHHISISSAAIAEVIEILFDITKLVNYLAIAIFISIIYAGPVLYLRKK